MFLLVSITFILGTLRYTFLNVDTTYDRGDYLIDAFRLLHKKEDNDFSDWGDANLEVIDY